MSPHSFSPNRRLHFRWEYLQFFKQNQLFKLSECALFRIKNNKEHYRLGITLKARGSSVERNRVKRQIREFFRVHGDQLGCFDYNVVIPINKKMGFPYPQRLAKCLHGQLLNAISDR